MGAAGVCLSADDIRVAGALADMGSEEARLSMAARSMNDEDDEEDDDDEMTRSGSEYEVANEDDDDDDERRGPIMQSLRSEEATPLYLADAPIRIHKYNFQQVNDDSQKIDDFVRYIESVNGSSDDDEDENDDDDESNENAQDDYKSGVLNSFLNRIGIPTGGDIDRNNNDELENSINNGTFFLLLYIT